MLPYTVTDNPPPIVAISPKEFPSPFILAPGNADAFPSCFLSTSNSSEAFFFMPDEATVRF